MKLSICFLLFIVVVRGQEPVCSRFHYESQTLEKMIRQEISVEKMRADMEETKNQVLSATAELRAERETFKREMDNMKTVLEIEKQRMVTDLMDIKDRMLIPIVAFQANTLKTRQPAAGETFVFTNTSINKGDGYDNQTGMFTAPNKGLYSFNLHLCLEDLNSQVFYQITSSVKSFLKGRLVNPNGCCYACFSVQTFALLEREEKVFVKMISTSISGKNVIWEREELITNHFAGVLLQIDN